MKQKNKSKILKKSGLNSQLRKDLEKFSRLRYHYFHNRFRTPIYTYILWEGLTKHYNNEVQFNYEINNMINLNNDLAADLNEWNSLVERIENFLKKDKLLLEKLMNMAIDLNLKIVKLARELSRERQKNLIKKKLNLFFENSYKFGAFNIFTLLVEKSLENKLKEIIKIRFGKDEDKIFQILTTPQELSAIQEKEIDLLKIAEMSMNNKEKYIKKHLEKFAWLKNSSYNGEFYTLKEVMKEIKKIKNINQQYKEKEEIHKKEFAKYFHYLENNEKELVRVLLKSINFRSWRTERFYFNAFILNNLFMFLGKEIGLKDYKDIFYLTPPEILNLIEERKVNLDLIEERKKGYVMISDKFSTRIYSGNNVKKFKKKINFQEKLNNKIEEISGQIVYPGNAIGNARVINKREDLKKVKRGEILITEMTTPDYVPSLKLVKGIATNEGGIMCHAAIISRELKIPCIVGTKIVTKIFKNGDLIEIDANKGIIKLIKKK
ncbi:MAG: PEP-utilizing enzyme [archaeon]